MVSQYSRSLGTARPTSVVTLESVIWKAIFDIARGEIDVYAAARVISDAIPEILSKTALEDKFWFHFGSSLSSPFSLLLLIRLCS